MPFQSEKQRRFLWANEPEIAERWSHEYGSKPRPKKKRHVEDEPGLAPYRKKEKRK